MASYICTSCRVPYGKGDKPYKKLVPRYCNGCWDMHLALMRQNWRRKLAADAGLDVGEVPEWRGWI